MRPELADALHKLRSKATVVEANAVYVREHGKLKGELLEAIKDAETASKEICDLVRGMEALIG